MMRLLAALWIVGLWAVSAAPAAAQTDATARAQALFDDAQKAIVAGDYDAAAAKFKEAHAAKPIPDLLYNIGAAYYLKGKQKQDAAAYELAIKHYRDYLRAAPRAADKADVEKAIAIIEREIKRLGSKAGAPTEVAALDARPRSLLVIESEPQGANIYLDDKARGPFAVTPWSGTLDGPHKIIVEKRGHKSKEMRVVPDPQRLVVIQIVLAEEDYLGWLEVKSNVPGASIFLDDKAAGAIGKTPFAGNVKPGKHKVWVAADGYDEAERAVTVVAGQVHTLDVPLSGAPVGYVDVRGAGGRVVIDGEVLCERAPCRKPVPEGVRTLRITRSGYKPYKVRLDVQPRTEISVHPRMARTPSRTDAVVAYIFAIAFAGAGTGAYVYQRDLTPGDTLYDERNAVRYGAYAGWGLGGVVLLSAIYYTFRDKGPPSSGQIEIRAVALEPAIGAGYAGVGVGGRF